MFACTSSALDGKAVGIWMANVYLAGFLDRLCSEEYECKSILESGKDGEILSDSEQLLLINKTFEYIPSGKGLKVPRQVLVKVTVSTLSVCVEEFLRTLRIVCHSVFLYLSSTKASL